MQPGLFKYYAAGAALKLASLNTITRRMYRALGNFRNAYKPETKIAEKYFFRSGKFLEMLRHDLGVGRLAAAAIERAARARNQRF